MRTITLNTKQQRRADILTRLNAGKLNVREAAELLTTGQRHLRRLLRRFEAEGLASLVHGNSGRTPVNRTDPALVQTLVALCGQGGKYDDFNISHLAELLARDEAIVLPRSTLSHLLRTNHVRLPQRSRQVKRSRRERKSQEGMLLQIDATPYDWLEGRGPQMALIGAIDDATGKIIYLCFRPTEDQAGYLLMLRAIATTYGLPLALYHDRHTILRSPKEPTLDDQLAGRRPQSQVQRVLATTLHHLHRRTLAARPKGESNGCGAPYKIGSRKNCAWLALTRWRRPTPFCPALLQSTMRASHVRPPIRRVRGLISHQRWTCLTTFPRARSVR